MSARDLRPNSPDLVVRVAARLDLIDENTEAVAALHARAEALHGEAAETPWHAPLRKGRLIREAGRALREAHALLDRNDALLSASYTDLASGR